MTTSTTDHTNFRPLQSKKRWSSGPPLQLDCSFDSTYQCTQTQVSATFASLAKHQSIVEQDSLLGLYHKDNHRDFTSNSRIFLPQVKAHFFPRRSHCGNSHHYPDATNVHPYACISIQHLVVSIQRQLPWT
ncbi:unnamed protein product [Zymoseptoria tritici ST99CH_3D1]|nr:unnamed protein product [Zymoseptoria tritici ST99CH_3D1]